MLCAVFRADASMQIGGGHIMRCLTLANFLADHGWTCCFAVGPDTLQTMPTLSTSNHDIYQLQDCSADHAEEEAASIGAKYPDIDLLVVDHYQRDAIFETAMRPYSRKILVIDDIPKRLHDCDVLLDQTFGRQPADYEGITPPSACFLMGTDYALLRPEFKALRAKALERRQVSKEIKRLLVSLGASDPHKVTNMCLEAVKQTGMNVEIDVVVGNGDPDAMGLTVLAEQMTQTVIFHGFEADMADLMVNADLAIGAAGSTSWERCCLGLPTLMIVTADNQLTIANQLGQAGAAIVLPRAEKLTPDDIAHRLTNVNKGEALPEMSARAAETCDGLGASRAFLAILQCNLVGEVSLQATTMNDAKNHLEWQSHPDTRKYFRNNAVPSKKQHMQWMTNRLARHEHVLLNIVDATGNCGVLRLDPFPKQDGTHTDMLEISILIAPHARGRGLASRALELSNRIFSGDHIIAEIHPDNKASWLTFQRAGFRKISKDRLERVAHMA
ncbi:MAG: UDP-2,4-diacetamido-2,4,6-trideoxy-beta-L-altropyranose hydrolase [bacterium]|nr:UDP-2,4-diacetamido-2,4,6-trideoxy-beta-L-altropyranose hydrolase [bacterium]